VVRRLASEDFFTKVFRQHVQQIRLLGLSQFEARFGSGFKLLHTHRAKKKPAMMENDGK
jgi:hypothetical protein